MRILFVFWMVLLGFGELPAQGNILKVFKGKANDIATSLLSKAGTKAVILCFGITVMLTSLNSCTPALKQERNSHDWLTSRTTLLTALGTANQDLKDGIDMVGFAVTVDENGKLVPMDISPLAKSAPEDGENSEHLELLTRFTQLKIVDNLKRFEEDSGVSHRVTKLEELERIITTANPAEINPEVQEYFFKIWQDVAMSELVLDVYLLEDNFHRKNIVLDAFPQVNYGKVKYNKTTAKKLKHALYEKQHLLSEFLQGDISREDFREEYANYRAYTRALVSQAYGVSKYHARRSISATSRMASVRGRNVKPEDYDIKLHE